MFGEPLDLIGKIKNARLPGAAAHKRFAPPYRPEFSAQDITDKHPKLAAVNILFYQKDGEWHIPLILRANNINDRHSGQISLPGGKREESDRDFAQTALRETTEEIGISADRINIIRSLTTIYIPPSNFLVHPYLSYTTAETKFILQEAEAESLIELPLSHLRNLSEQIENEVLPWSHHTKVPVIKFEEHRIWGATSMILGEFCMLLKNL